MSSMIEDVYEFNAMIHQGLQPVNTEAQAQADWLIRALQEELTEFQADDALASRVDALIDLAYYAIGGLYRLGLSRVQAEEAWALVHHHNMGKRPGAVQKRAADGVAVVDAVKPEGFLPPQTKFRL